ncbi:hypothetical protein Tco_0001724 [Tanacetum coccineum]
MLCRAVRRNFDWLYPGSALGGRTGGGGEQGEGWWGSSGWAVIRYGGGGRDGVLAAGDVFGGAAHRIGGWEGCAGRAELASARLVVGDHGALKGGLECRGEWRAEWGGERSDGGGGRSGVREKAGSEVLRRGWARRAVVELRWDCKETGTAGWWMGACCTEQWELGLGAVGPRGVGDRGVDRAGWGGFRGFDGDERGSSGGVG